MKRFWKQVSVEATDGGHAVLLDARPLRTPQRRELVVPTRALALQVAAEWDAAGETLDIPSMRATRLATTRIDLFPEREPDARAEVAGYLGTDLLSYRAETPADLVLRQRDGWDPWVAWAARVLDLQLAVVTGVVAADPDPASVAILQRHLQHLDPWRLVAVHAATVVTGSLVLGFALDAGAIDAAGAFATAQLDELYEIERWGMTDLAAERHARLNAELAAIAAFAAALRQARQSDGDDR